MNIDLIHAAAERLEGRVLRTPLLSSPFLDEIAGRHVLIKPECLQHTGSFKFRGVWAALTALEPSERAAGIFAYSSGNHAQGVALAARMNNVPSTILMPRDAPDLKIANTRALGAEVVTYDRATENREEIGTALAKERGLKLIRPFDDPNVIAGQATTGLEIAQQFQGTGLTQVLVPCGGGGLTSGIALALAAEAPDMLVRPVEPEGFDDAARSLASGAIQTNPQQTGSLCDAIITPAPGDLTFPIMRKLCGPGLQVSDDDALRAMAAAYTRLKLVLEPGGAVALAAALYHPRHITGDTVIVVASGGNVDASLFTTALSRFGDGS